jgi:glucokinase-like ROK family protein
MKIKTGNQGFLRQQNLAGIFQHLYENAPVSRIELARLTGLNKATVTNLINNLIRSNFVCEVGEATDKRAGRREVLLDLNPRRGCFLSAEIGVGFISVACTNFAAQIIWKQRQTTENLEPEFLLGETVKLLKKGRRVGEKKCGALEGVAVGIPGLVDQKSGRLLFAPNLNWRNVEIRPRLEKKFETTVFIDNEATFAALGEKFFGVAKGSNNVLYISAGVGIGGGLIINGQIYNGAAGYASEFGHMTMNPEGERCACGNLGCWETHASQAALFREIKRLVSAGNSTLISEMLGGDLNRLSVQVIVEAAREQDAVALQALRKIGVSLGLGIDSLIKAFNPELVVFGGILSLAEEFLLPSIKQELKKRWLLESIKETPVVAAHFGSDAAVMGGIAKIFQAILANPVR